MKTIPQRFVSALVTCALMIATRSAFALGSDYPNDRSITGSTNWPKGLGQLINATNRVHGFFVNQEDIFFYSGSPTELTAFLQSYSRLEGISHRLILHAGVGEAKSPWQKTGRPCDWKLYLCPKGWHNLGTLSSTNSVEGLRKAANEPGYISEIHFWTGGRIPLDKVEVPKNVEIKNEK
jgi:hypothetical protein